MPKWKEYSSIPCRNHMEQRQKQLAYNERRKQTNGHTISVKKSLEDRKPIH
jgi:hypothetical protein